MLQASSMCWLTRIQFEEDATERPNVGQLVPRYLQHNLPARGHGVQTS